MDPLETPIRDLAWVNPSLGRGLTRLGIETWRDLLEHYPRRHEDRSRFGQFPTASSETPTCIRGVITRITGRYFARRKIVEATVEEDNGTALSGRVTCRWFNQYYVQRMLSMRLGSSWVKGQSAPSIRKWFAPRPGRSFACRWHEPSSTTPWHVFGRTVCA